MTNTTKIRIIAEAGVNHNGDLDTAKQLIDVAAEAGADFVKFQTFKAEKLVGASAQKADYQKESLNDGDGSQMTMLQKLELDDAAHLALMKHCRKRNIQFLSTAFDLDSLDFLHNLGLHIFKVPSGEITNFPYLKKMASLASEVIVSTGMATLGEVDQAIKVLETQGMVRDKITVLHCNTEYPTPMADVNLKAMANMGRAFGVKFGYSDHTAGIEVPVAAAALGATVIEKHFTLDKNQKGPDHRASLDPRELKAMVVAIRNIEIALGDGIKKPSPSELKNLTVARKSIHLSREISAGDFFSEENIIALRPADGISPMSWEDVIGKRARYHLNKGHQLQWTDIER